jgi:hypothetical protein
VGNLKTCRTCFWNSFLVSHTTALQLWQIYSSPRLLDEAGCDQRTAFDFSPHTSRLGPSQKGTTEFPKFLTSQPGPRPRVLALDCLHFLPLFPLYTRPSFLALSPPCPHAPNSIHSHLHTNSRTPRSTCIHPPRCCHIFPSTPGRPPELFFPPLSPLYHHCLVLSGEPSGLSGRLRAPSGTLKEPLCILHSKISATQRFSKLRAITFTPFALRISCHIKACWPFHRRR